jgi:L-alanine-DL-glutamate epimerase-like enolase superfamily enzyme
MALWDLAGRIAGLPLHRLLGGKRHDRIRAASSIIFDTANLDGLGRQFADLKARGYDIQEAGYSGDVEAIIRTGQGWEGVSDPRYGGGGAAY